MSRTVLVVGATSSLGTALCHRLTADMSVITAGRRNCELDLDLRSPVERMVLPTGLHAVVHLAAHFGGSSPQALDEAIAVNGTGTLRLCAAAAAAGVRHFLYVSTIFALAQPGTPGYGAYAVAKRLGEDAARLVCDAGAMSLGILRPSAMYGAPAALRVHQPFFYRIIDHARDGRDVVLYGTHDPRRNYVHVDDVAAALGLMVMQGTTGTFGCQSPIDVTYAEVAQTAFAVYGKGGRVRFDDTRPDVPDNVFPIDDSLQRAAGFRPSIDLREGLERLARGS